MATHEVEADTTAKRVLYAAAGIPGYLVLHFDKDWARISEIEEYGGPGNRRVLSVERRVLSRVCARWRS